MVLWGKQLHGKITTGGVKQINTPINVKALEDIGILQNKGGW